MGCISNAECEREPERVNRRNLGRKIFTCVTFVFYLAFLVLSFFLTFLSKLLERL